MIFPLLLALISLKDGSPRTYQAWLDTPGGDLRFGLELRQVENERWSAFLLNGEERIEVPRVSFDGKQLVLDMPHYDSRIRAEVVSDVRDSAKDWGHASSGSCLDGVWEKRRGANAMASLRFRAVQPVRTLCGAGLADHDPFGGRWAVDFETDDEGSVAVLTSSGIDRELRGTFLTATGDYRYLSGSQDDKDFELSCFDGAHAFLFKAALQPDGTLKGDFWSGNWHHETWTAKRDDSAELADPFAQTTWNGKTKLAELVFPDLDGKPHSFGEFAGQATLLVVLGSWCPNCNDEAPLLKELDARYRARGLRILGLAFELTGEFARDAEQVRIFQQRHGLALPFFLCGTADKAEATKALGLVDGVRAFPTTIFVGADGLPKAIHSGFAGPATGEEHHKLRREFEARIEALLGGK